MLIITRALLGHAFVDHSPPSSALAPPLLPDAPNNERCVGQESVVLRARSAFGCSLTRLLCLHPFFSYDSVIATPPGECREIILFDNTQIYPELVVYYTAN